MLKFFLVGVIYFLYSTTTQKYDKLKIHLEDWIGETCPIVGSSKNGPKNTHLNEL